MIHQFRDKKQINRRKKVIKIIIILSIFAVLAFSGFFSLSKKFLNFIGKPIWEAKEITLYKTNDLSDLTKSKSSLLDENEKILQENLDLKIEMVDYQIVKDENEKLKELLGVIKNPSSFVLASILVKPSHSPYDTLIIDAGKRNGISEGFKVYVNGTVPIGIISEVYENTSMVELYSNPSKVTSGVIEGLDINVDIVGRGGGNFEMSIPFELTVSNGTMITLPGIESEVIAVVEEEISEPTDPVKKVILNAPINIQNHKWVEVKIN